MKKLLLSAAIVLITLSFSFGQGTVRGKITDVNGETLIGATVVLKSNPSVGSVTDFDGNYSLKISEAAPQTLVVSYISYKTIEEPVKAFNNEVIIKNFVLLAAANEIKEVVITGKAVKARNYYMEKVKMNSSTTIDYVSSETMRKTGDANVTTAIARVSGVSTSGGLITVRGIGDRYVKTSINGSRIPTLDPFTNNIKLDLFPSSLVDNIIITKTASPDLPGDWAGAYLSVETKDYPDQLTINVESSIGYNSQSTFKDMLTSQRSSTDWKGYDKSFREHNHNDFVQVIPQPSLYQEFVALGMGAYFNAMGINKSWDEGSSIGETYFKLGLVELGLLAPALYNDVGAYHAAKAQYENGPYKGQAFNVINAEGAKSGQAFPNNWNTFTRKAPLNYSQSFSIGTQTNLFGRPLGVLAGFRYGSGIATDMQSIYNKASVDAGGLRDTAIALTQPVSRETNGWSALMNLAYKFNTNNSVSFLFMPNYTGVNNVRNSGGKDNSSNYDSIFTKSQFYEQRKQLVYQFKSEHYLPGSKIKVETNASYTNGTSSAPDFKSFEYYLNNDSLYEISRTASKTNRYYRYLTENIFDSRLSVEFPLGNKPGLARKLKFGGAYQHVEKENDQYDYFLQFTADDKYIIENGNIDGLFSLENFGIVDNKIGNYYTELGNPSNHNIGSSMIIAGFGMLDYTIIPSLRFSGGLRVEQADIFTDVYKYDSLGLAPGDPRRQYEDDPNEHVTPNPGTLNELSFLPSANIIFKLKADELAPVNLRFNYSQTIARPSIRELSETVVYDFEFKETVFGNSELKMVKIKNYDLRLESYFKSGDNASVSLFYKSFKDHIELVKTNYGFSWQNVDKSQVVGLELEGKKAFTKQFSLTANVTFVYSQTKFIQYSLQANNGIRTYIPRDTIKRAMFGQAPYAINCIFSYSFDSLGLTPTLSYNLQGRRLAIAKGTDGTPDIYELPSHLLDFKITKTLGRHFSASLTIRDILNSSITRSYIYDDGEKVTYDIHGYGTSYTLGIAYKL